MSERMRIVASVTPIAFQHTGWIDSLAFEVIEITPEKAAQARVEPGRYVRFRATEDQCVEVKPTVVEVIFPLEMAQKFIREADNAIYKAH